MVVNELRGEKIDVVPWSDNPGELVANALQPAKVKEVRTDEATGTAQVIVPDYQLSLAIGKEGQNARLAARLTGWRIDIKSETQASEESRAPATPPRLRRRDADARAEAPAPPEAPEAEARGRGRPSAEAAAEAEASRRPTRSPTSPRRRARRRRSAWRRAPERTCAGCRARAPRGSLLRIVRGADGVRVDRSGSAPGRGAYVHRGPGVRRRGARQGRARAGAADGLARMNWVG